jgi:hypothetical protein
MDIKYPQWPCRKISQHTIKYISTFSILSPSKIYPNWDFGFENVPSGNPAVAKRKAMFQRHWPFFQEPEREKSIFLHRRLRIKRKKNNS